MDLNTLFDEINVSPLDEKFSFRLFRWIAKEKKREKAGMSEADLIASEEFTELSRRLEKSKFQDSAAVRNLILSRQIAKFILREDGNLDRERVVRLKEAFIKRAFALNSDREADSARRAHFIKVLEALHSDKQYERALKLITRPLSSKPLDELIRKSLELRESHSIQDYETRQAVLSALFAFLRQNVGSCFATAPAILIHDETPLQFLKDIGELIATGRLKRTFLGIEHAVPLSTSFGVGDFRRKVFIDPGHEKDLRSLALSPGIRQALEATRLIDEKLERPEKAKASEELALQALVRMRERNELSPFVSAEDLIEEILLHHFKISKSDITEFQKRPREMIHTSLIMSAPISRGGGKGDHVSSYFQAKQEAKNAFCALSDHPLLKAWEFTVASFAESKPAFSRWNMYASLGFDEGQKGGIGEILFSKIESFFNRTKERLEELQRDSEMLYQQLKFSESRLKGSTSEKEAAWGRAEFESRRSEFQTIVDLRDRQQAKLSRYSELFRDLLEKYDALFPLFFQEVYDPDMHEVKESLYDDSPAGFRLLYKHGRANTSQWTLIYSPQEFIQSLSSFFVATEIEIENDPQFQGLDEEIGALVSELVLHVKSDAFLLSSMERVARAHGATLPKDPLENLDQISKKPWAYTSGGTMDNLLSGYFRLEGRPKQVERWVENEMELLVFLIETTRQLPQAASKRVLEDGKSLLMHSPTHAFLLKPSLYPFRKAVESDQFAYTFARDEFFLPQKRLIDTLFLDEEMMTFLLEKFSESFRAPFQERIRSFTKECYGKKTPPEFRSLIAYLIEMDPLFQLHGGGVTKEMIDSFLYQALPLTSRLEMLGRIERLLEKIVTTKEMKEKKRQILELIDAKSNGHPYLTASELCSLAESVMMILLFTTYDAKNIPLLIRKRAAELFYAMPQPIFFADSNWAKDLFAFVVNPGTGLLDFWRVTRLGHKGAPMSSWRQFLDGTRRDLTFGVYTETREYQA